MGVGNPKPKSGPWSHWERRNLQDLPATCWHRAPESPSCADLTSITETRGHVASVCTACMVCPSSLLYQAHPSDPPIRDNVASRDEDLALPAGSAAYQPWSLNWTHSPL